MSAAPAPALREGTLGRVPSPVLVVGAIGSVQFGSALATTLFAAIGPSGAVLLRLLSATVALLIVWRPRIHARARRELALAALFGVVLAAMNLSFYEAISRIPLGIGVTIEFIGPLSVAVFGTRRRRDLVWVVLAAAGILALMRGGGHSVDLLGALLALAAGAMWAAYILVNARVGQAFSGGTGLALAMCVATLLALPIGLLQGGGQILTGHALLVGTAVGMLSSAIPYTLEMEALRRIATSVFGVLMSLEPAVAAFAGWLIIGQSLSARQLIGMALVIIASGGASWQARDAAVAV